MISAPAAVTIEVALGVLTALLAGGAPASSGVSRRARGRPPIIRRISAYGAALAASSSCFLIPPSYLFLRGAIALSGALALARVIDLDSDPRPWSAAQRIWLFAALVDVRRARRIPPALEARLVAAGFAYALLAALAFWLALVQAERLDGPARLTLRWGAGAVAAYAVPDVAAGLITAGYRALGVQLPPLHRMPILSRSLQEFWGERWNIVVSVWLAEHCFVPLARRRLSLLGFFAAFAASAALHFWFVFVPLGLSLALLMAGFFLVQGVLYVIERWLGVRRWPALAGHAWTVLAVLAPSPLFVEPLLRMLGG